MSNRRHPDQYELFSHSPEVFTQHRSMIWRHSAPPRQANNDFATDDATRLPATWSNVAGVGYVIEKTPRRVSDRAAVLAKIVRQIMATVSPRERQQALEDYLRDEFANIERQAAADREIGDG
jgi:hypothetical protein